MPFSTSTDPKPAQPRKGGRPRRECGHPPIFDTEGRCVACRNTRLRTKYKNDEATRTRKKVSATKFKRSNPVLEMLSSARERAKAGGYPCTITVNDIAIPEFCPLLGIRLERGVGKPTNNSPALDKIRPKLGYVPGNVWVVSHRANQLKNNGTFQELQTLVENLAKTYVTYPWDAA